MTRRKFLQTMLTAGATAIAIGWALAKTIVPRKFMFAKPLSKYPGPLKPLNNITSQAKWSG